VVPKRQQLGSLEPALAGHSLGPAAKLPGGGRHHRCQCAVLAAGLASGDGLHRSGQPRWCSNSSVDRPIRPPGVSRAPPGSRCFVGGASNSGGGVLRQFFKAISSLRSLSRQNRPQPAAASSSSRCRGRGERFPVDDARSAAGGWSRPCERLPVLQGLLEGMAQIEAEAATVAGAWRLQRSGGCHPRGGGQQSPIWRRLSSRPWVCR